MKKEFISYWSAERVSADTHEMPLVRSGFFNETTSHRGRAVEIIVPDSISHKDLYAFTGRKTKVTIEVID